MKTQPQPRSQTLPKSRPIQQCHLNNHATSGNNLVLIIACQYLSSQPPLSQGGATVFFWPSKGKARTRNTKGIARVMQFKDSMSQQTRTEKQVETKGRKFLFIFVF